MLGSRGRLLSEGQGKTRGRETSWRSVKDLGLRPGAGGRTPAPQPTSTLFNVSQAVLKQRLFPPDSG